MIDEQKVHEQAQDIERLIREVEQIAEPHLCEKVVTLVQSLLGFHASAIEKLMQIIAAEGEGAGPLLKKLGDDELVGSLLLLYGVHPLSFETRVRYAIERLHYSPVLNSTTVELVGIANRVVRLRFAQCSNHCQSSQQTIRSTIEDALYEAAPDIDEIQFVDETRQASVGFVSLDSVRGRNGLTRTLNATLPGP